MGSNDRRMIHALKNKKKNINRELGKLYDKKRSVLSQILKLEEAKINLKIKLGLLRTKQKKIKKG